LTGGPSIIETTLRIPPAIDELMAKGFIERRHAGGTAKHDMAIYALSEKWRLWTQGARPFQMREVGQHHGYQGRPLGAAAKYHKTESANIAHETEPIHTHETEPIPAS
jgi:DNA-binding PadR family transcriptional regulator